MAKNHKVELVATRKGCQICEREDRYDVLLNGEKFAQLYFNMRGYVGLLPLPNGHRLDIGERAISAYRKEVSAINRGVHDE